MTLKAFVFQQALRTCSLMLAGLQSDDHTFGPIFVHKLICVLSSVAIDAVYIAIVEACPV